MSASSMYPLKRIYLPDFEILCEEIEGGVHIEIPPCSDMPWRNALRLARVIETVAMKAKNREIQDG